AINILPYMASVNGFLLYAEALPPARTQSSLLCTWSPFALAQQHRARRTRPGAGTPGTSVCPIRRRLQHLRSQRTSRSTGDGQHHAIHHATAQAQGEREEECGSATAGAEVSRIQFH